MRCPRCFRKLAPAAVCPVDGAVADDEAPGLAIDRTALPAVPGWVVDGFLGAGGQAAAWHGRRRADDQRAAIKIAHGAGANVVAGFAEEAAVLAAIGAPAVAELFEYGALADRRPFIAMELLEGATLGDRLSATATVLALDEVVGWLGGIARSLGALHAAGFVHRDLKPENVMRDRAGVVRLLDLGLAQRVRPDPGEDSLGRVVGTPLYMAPEQLRGEPVSARADLYALGALGFEAATARPPFVGDRAAIELGHLAFRPPRASSLRAVPAGLDALLSACLAKDPDERPVDAAAVAAQLDALDLDALVRTAAPTPVANRASVALVAVERAPATHNLDVEAARRGGQVARQTPGRAVLAFVSDECAAPLPAALATAQALHALGARVAVHVAPVTARRGKDGRTMLFGAAVERPVEWIPSPTATGVLLTETAARELTADRLERVDGGWRLRDQGESGKVPESSAGPLLASAALIASARASARAALDGGPPATWIALGGAGSGKSRLADELAGIAAEDGEVAVVRLSGHRSFGAGAAAATRDLFEGLGAFATPAQVASPQPLVAQVRAAIDAVLAARGLAIVIDDAQWIDDALMAALGVAARASTGPLWLAVTGADGLAAARPTWLDGARVSVESVARFDEADTCALLRRALAPARRVPEALVARLAARCGGVPGVVTALARELRRAGVIRRHPGSEVWFVAADELDFLPPTPGLHWFAARQLASLGPGLAELGRVCALLGARFGRGELDAATRVVEAGVAIDPGIGVAQLVARGLLVDDAGQARFRSEAEQDAIADAVPVAVRRAVHAAVLAHLLAVGADEPDTWARVAYHAGRAGDAACAIAFAERLAAEARARHAPLEAVRWSTLALEHAGDQPTPLRQRLLGERGAARRLLTHYEAAQLDLRAARAIAEAHGDAVAIVELLVADGACCDFTERLVESARLIEEAAARAPAGLPAAVQARLDNWLGVVRARQERLDEARTLLVAAIAQADRLGDHDTAIGSRLMLGGVLRRAGLVDDGRATLDRAIELCDRVGDHFHLAIGLFNRINVWRRLDRTDAAEADAERAIELANRMGLDQIELWGWYNLSEVRWWTGDLAGAFTAAENSHRIGSERFRESPPVVGSLWFAMLLAAAGELANAQRILDEIRPDDLASNPGLVLTRDAVRLACAGAVGSAWERVVAEAQRDTAEAEDAVFVGWLRAITARRVGALDEAAACTAATEAAALALGRRPPPTCWPG